MQTLIQAGCPSRQQTNTLLACRCTEVRSVSCCI